MKKEQFLELCRENPEEIFELFTSMSETVVTFEAQVKALKGQVKELKAEVKDLKAQLNKNSHNSNKPPSSDEFTKPKSQRKKSGKKTGGQKGHPGHTLEMSDNPDEIIVHRDKNCHGCGRVLDEQTPVKKERRQTFDIPVPRVEVTEHISETLPCPDCGLENKAAFPKEVTQPTQYGKRILAQITYLNQYQFIPYNRIVEYFEDIYLTKISEGTIGRAIETVYEALSSAEEEIISGLLNSKAINVDETGIRIEGKRKWLHAVTTSDLTHYMWHDKRGSIATDEIGILPEYEGIMIHDFWKPYYNYDCTHSLCNVHNIRELTGIHELTGQNWAQEMIELLLDIKERIDDLDPEDKLSVKTKQAFTERYDEIIENGYLANPPPEQTKKRGRPKQGRARNMLNRLSEHRHEVLAFMEDSPAVFDNNQAERDIRMVKVKQKISGVFRSGKGADMFCRIRGYISTARKNSLSAFTAIIDALEDDPFVPEL